MPAKTKEQIKKEYEEIDASLRKEEKDYHKRMKEREEKEKKEKEKK